MKQEYIKYFDHDNPFPFMDVMEYPYSVGGDTPWVEEMENVLAEDWFPLDPEEPKYYLDDVDFDEVAADFYAQPKE